MDTLARMRELMKERKWSAYRLARQAELPASTVNNMFRRNHCPTISTLERFCKAFGISLSQFFSEGQEPVALTPEQSRLLEHYARLSDSQRAYLQMVIEGMLTN